MLPENMGGEASLNVKADWLLNATFWKSWLKSLEKLGNGLGLL